MRVTEQVLVGEAEEAADGEQLDRRGVELEGPAEEEDLRSEDCQPKVVAPDPGRPSQAEIDEHCIDHLPFRSWCECCVRGRGTGEQHRPAGESQVPIIAFD